MTTFRCEPFEVLTMNAIIVKLYIFYPNIRIIRLKRHYLPLVLLLVLPHWWGDARCREKSASSCFKVTSKRQAPSTWSEPAIFGGFSARFPFRVLIHFVSRIFCVIENHYVHTAKSFSFSGLKLINLGKIWWLIEAQNLNNCLNPGNRCSSNWGSIHVLYVHGSVKSHEILRCCQSR
jgi:hypothetical protein